LYTRNRVVLFIVIGVVLIIIGVVAGISLFNRINANNQPAQAQSQVVTSDVVVLKHDMNLGDLLQASDLSLVKVPVDLVPRDAVTSVDEAVGKYIKSDMVQGEMLLQHNVANPTNNNHDLSFILSKDHVLMAFPATDLMSQESIVQRGDIIDILATVQETVQNIGSSSTTTTTTTTNGEATPVVSTFTLDAFQRVSVTALVLDVVAQNTTGSVTSQTNAPISSYLLALDPQDALILKHLKDLGATFDIVLRAPTSTVQFDLTPVTEEYIVELYGLQILP
jgi:pilus assembly protein CpaB